MRALARHLFTCCAALSLALFAAACWLWVRSYSMADTWDHRRLDGAVTSEFVIHSHAGAVGFFAHSYQPVFPVSAKPWTHVSRPAATTAAPFWFTPEGRVAYAHLAVYTGVLPLWWAARRYGWTSRQRRRLGLCLSCGYDLRASLERCPECGAAASLRPGVALPAYVANPTCDGVASARQGAKMERLG